MEKEQSSKQPTRVKPTDAKELSDESLESVAGGLCQLGCSAQSTNIVIGPISPEPLVPPVNPLFPK